MAYEGVNHDLRSADGGTIYMPPYIGGEKGWGNLVKPNVYLASSKQEYPRGTMFRKGSSSYVYTKLLDQTTPIGDTSYGGITQGLGLFSDVAVLSRTPVTGSCEKGELTFTTNAIGANAYAGGLLSVYESGQPYAIRNIVSNTTTVITLDEALPGTYTASATAYVLPSPYKQVIMPGASQGAGGAWDYCPGLFISTADEDGNIPAADDFVWLQTAGMIATWASGSYEGATGGERVVVIHGQGACQALAAGLIATQANHQVVGHLVVGCGPGTFGNDGANTGGTDAGFAFMGVMLNIRQ